MKARQIMAKAAKAGWRNLTEYEAEKVLQQYGLPCSAGKIAKNAKQAKQIGKELGYPVVLKVCSPSILHKTDAGGVFLHVGAEDIEKKFKLAMRNARRYRKDAKILGVLIQHMAKPGTEVIIGMKRDAQFGPAIAFGLGGIFVEILKDVSFRIAPLAERDVDEMIKETKGYEVLKGARGHKPKDIGALKKMLLQLSKFVMDFPEVREVDLNPVFVYTKGARVVDARIVLGEA